MPPRIPDLLQEKHVELTLRSVTPEDAIREIVYSCAGNRHILDIEGFYRAMVEREHLKSTAAGDGIAFPHARTDFVDKIVVAAGRSEAGISFGGKAGRVHLIFVIGTPKAMITQYLVCVGALARTLKNAEIRKRLMLAATAAEFVTNLAGNDRTTGQG